MALACCINSYLEYGMCPFSSDSHIFLYRSEEINWSLWQWWVWGSSGTRNCSQIHFPRYRKADGVCRSQQPRYNLRCYTSLEASLCIMYIAMHSQKLLLLSCRYREWLEWFWDWKCFAWISLHSSPLLPSHLLHTPPWIPAQQVEPHATHTWKGTVSKKTSKVFFPRKSATSLPPMMHVYKLYKIDCDSNLKDNNNNNNNIGLLLDLHVYMRCLYVQPDPCILCGNSLPKALSRDHDSFFLLHIIISYLVLFWVLLLRRSSWRKFGRRRKCLTLYWPWHCLVRMDAS